MSKRQETVTSCSEGWKTNIDKIRFSRTSNTCHFSKISG